MKAHYITLILMIKAQIVSLRVGTLPQAMKNNNYTMAFIVDTIDTARYLRRSQTRTKVFESTRRYMSFRLEY